MTIRAKQLITAEGAGDRSVLVDAGWLASHLGDRAVRVVEVDVSSARYDEWHIDGAVLWNVYSDLKDPEYRLAEPAALEELLSRSGIGPESTVVFYGYAPALGFWLLTLLGHREHSLLHCSRDTWRAGGRPWTSTVSCPAPRGGPHRRPRPPGLARRPAPSSSMWGSGSTHWSWAEWGRLPGNRGRAVFLKLGNPSGRPPNLLPDQSKVIKRIILMLLLDRKNFDEPQEVLLSKVTAASSPW